MDGEAGGIPTGEDGGKPRPEAMPDGWEHPVDRHTQVEGQHVRYWEEGTGPPLLLIHGLGTSAESWQRCIFPLSRQFRIMAPDLPGFGLSSHPREGFTVGAGVRFLQRFLDARGVRRAAIAGTSMGGLLAAHLALEAPDRVARLIMGDSAGLGRDLGLVLRLLSIPGIGELLAFPTRAALRRAFGGLFHDRSRIPEFLVPTIYRQRRRPGRVAALLRAARHGIELRGQRKDILLGWRLGQIVQPTLIIWGRDDRLIPVSHAYIAHRAIPDCRLRIIEECGHMPMLERPEEYIAALTEFLHEKEVDWA